MSIATTKQELLSSLQDREFRAAFNLENVYTTVCFQLRALREQREMSQAVFAKHVKPKMAQERISILEDPNAGHKPTLKTLLRLADAFDVGLEVRFVPFSTVLSRSVHTNMHELQVDSFDVELPNIKAQIAFEAVLEASTIGVTQASNKLLVLPRRAEHEAEQANNSLVASLREITATPRPSAPVQSAPLRQNVVPTVSLNANAACARG